MEPPRSRAQRIADTLARLDGDADVWVATADADGTPYLVPLSLDWDGTNVIVSAERRSRTIQNLERSRVGRLGVGPTRDVVMIDVVVGDAWSAHEAPDGVPDHYARRTGWDPRAEGGDYVYVLLEPRRIQAWREANELAGRMLMRDGRWLDAATRR